MLKKVALLVVVGVIGLLVCATAIVVNCELSKSPPQASVYPGSVLLDQRITGIGRSRPIATYYYSSSDAPEKIVSFYSARGSCGVGERSSGRELCRGDAVPFGEYFVYIDLDSYLTRTTTGFALEVRWHGCSDRIE